MTHTTQQPNTRDEYGYPLRPNSRRNLRNIGVQTSKSALLASIYLLMSIVGFFLRLGRIGKHYPPLTPQTFHPRRILLIRLDLIGDLVLSLTVLRLLKRTYPEAEIDLLAVPSSAKVAATDPDLAEIIAYDPNVWRRPQALFQLQHWRTAFALLRHLRARQYDLAVSVFGNWAAIFTVLSGVKRRVGFGRESYPGFMTDDVPGRHWDPGDHKHEVDYCLELAQAAGATIQPEDRIPHLHVDPKASQEIELLLRQEGIQADAPLIACHVSSNNGQSKRWPIPYWARLMDRLIGEDGAAVVLTGAPADLPIIEDVTQRMRERPINLAGKTSLPQLAALLQRADLLITGDSGPMHIAGAVGTPLIALHGPTDPAHSGPISPTATVLRSDIWCSPCYNATGSADCRFYTTQCMKNITPKQVLDVVHQKLKRNSQARQEPVG
jgi:lipopolysaccharide heptosyltransferase II